MSINLYVSLHAYSREYSLKVIKSIILSDVGVTFKSLNIFGFN